MKLISENVVITAEQFNPSIVNQLWLVKNKLLEESDFSPGCIFADTIAQIRSREFDLLVVPQMAQFTPSAEVEADQKQTLVTDKLGELIRHLPETPYKAIGMNFTWQVEPRDTSIEAICRRLFFVPASPIHKFFDVPDGRFGSYLSKDTLGFRLKLTAVPAILGASSSSSADAIILKFNYHYDLAEQTDSVANICDRLARWNEAVAESSQIVSSVAE